MSQQHTIDFNALPERTRLRFIASTRQAAEPKPLYMNERPAGAAVTQAAVMAVGGLVFLAYVAWLGFGDSVDGSGYMVWYGGFGAVMVAGVFALIRARMIGKNMPYVEGSYLFPVDLIIAEGSTLTLLPLSSLTGINSLHQHDKNGAYTHTELRFHFGGDSHTMLIVGRQRVDALMQQMNDNRMRAAMAFEAEQFEIFAGLDALYEARIGGQWEQILATKNARPTSGPVARKLPIFIRHGMPIGGTLGFLIGAAVLTARNPASDDAMLDKAKREDSVASYAEYIDEGGVRHLDEIRDVLMPRAKLAAAINEYSVTALRRYRELYPDGPHDAEAKLAIHELFEVSQAKFEQQAKLAKPEVIAQMRILFAWLEANDSPPVQVSFRPPDPSLLQAVDAYLGALSSEDLDGMMIVPIGPSFTAEASAKRERWIAEELEAGFREVVPADILDLTIGAHIPAATDINTLTPTKALITVSYAVEPSDTFFSEAGDPRTYVGIQVYFLVSMLVPATDHAPAPDPLTFILQVQPPNEFSVSNETGISIEASDRQIYDVMAKKAFERLSRELYQALFAAADEGEDATLEVISGPVPSLPEAGSLLDEGEGETEESER